MRTLDPIGLEVFRSRLTAIADEAGDSILRTAISSIVTESKDCSATILDGEGNLIVGGGAMTNHWVAATRSVRSTLERFAKTLLAGGIFIANDLYNGGGLHANGVFVLRPVFWSGRVVAWIATSSHLMDVGGMVMGGLELRVGQELEVRCASGGGLGDPLDRNPEAVAMDVTEGAISLGDAADAYGVVLVEERPDVVASTRLRAERREARLRLRLADPPRRTMNGAVLDAPDGVPLYPGIVRRGRFAVAERSGAVLAESPDHWTDGCPVLVERRPGPGTAELLIRTYLDPITGAALHVEVCPDNEPRSFEINPAHWANAS